jgi:DNA-binding transcriptional regulator YiaG
MKEDNMELRKRIKSMKRKKQQRVTGGEQMIRDLKKLNRVITRGQSVRDRFTCNRIVLKLQPRKYEPAMVKGVRKKLGMSQAIFAQFLGVSAGTVRSWEQGQNPVPGIACRFLDELDRNPAYWQERLQESAFDKELVQSE